MLARRRLCRLERLRKAALGRHSRLHVVVSAADLCDEHQAERLVEAALMLGSLRRLIRPADAPRLPPVRQSSQNLHLLMTANLYFCVAVGLPEPGAAGPPAGNGFVYERGTDME